MKRQITRWPLAFKKRWDLIAGEEKGTAHLYAQAPTIERAHGMGRTLRLESFRRERGGRSPKKMGASPESSSRRLKLAGANFSLALDIVAL
jgi:hypothetical protein